MGRDELRDKEKLAQLRAIVARHNDLYYNKDRPEVSDSEYDGLYDELVGLERLYPQWDDPSSPTRRVGGRASPTFSPVTHDVPMLSLEKATTIDEVQKFFERCAKEAGEPAFLATPKLDGLAVSLRYGGGRLVCGATRGDGQVGEDITANLVGVDGVLRSLPAGAPTDVIVRGEVYMPHSSFDKTNALQRKRGLKEFVSPRNAAAGTLRQLEPQLVKERGLVFGAYWALLADGSMLSLSAREAYGMIEGWGFGVTAPYESVRSSQDFNAYLGMVQAASGERGHDIDGIVLRLDDTAAAERMGANAKAPRALLAFKFPPDMRTTILEGVDYQLGRTGTLTPVARLKPVKVGDVTVSNATLHNCMMVKSLGIHVGDTLSIVRAGDVIPKVVRVHGELRATDTAQVSLPDRCYHCGSELRWDSVNLVCPNDSCGGVISRRLIHFVSRKAMDIDGFGDKRIEALVDCGLLSRPADIYKLDKGILGKPMRISKEKLRGLVDDFISELGEPHEYVRKGLKASFVEYLGKCQMQSSVSIVGLDEALENFSEQAMDTQEEFKAGVLDAINNAVEVVLKKAGEPGSLSDEDFREQVGIFVSKLKRPAAYLSMALKESFKDILSEHSMLSSVGIGNLERSLKNISLDPMPAHEKFTAEVSQAIIGSVEARPVMTGKQIELLLESIEKSKQTNLARVLNAIGVEGLGETGSKALAGAFGSLSSIAQAGPEVLCFVDAVNYTTAQEVCNLINDVEGDELGKLAGLGVVWDEPGPAGVDVPMHALLAHVRYLFDAMTGDEEDAFPSISGSFVASLQESPELVTRIEDLVDEEILRQLCKQERQAKAVHTSMESLLDNARFKHMVEQMEKLLGARWCTTDEIVGSDGSGVLGGMGVVITGVLPGLGRDEAKELVERNGGKPLSSVSRNTNLVVVGDKPGASKVKKAGELGVRTMDAAEFLRLVDGS